MASGSEQKVWSEEIKIEGEKLLSRVKELIHEGNIRRIVLKNEGGKTIVEVPFTLGLVGAAAVAVWAPILAAIAAIGALLTRCSIIVERVEE